MANTNMERLGNALAKDFDNLATTDMSPAGFAAPWDSWDFYSFLGEGTEDGDPEGVWGVVG